MNDVNYSIAIRSQFPLACNKSIKRKPVFGFGINDADYLTQASIGGVSIACPCYIAWKSVIKRSFDVKYKKLNKTYEGVYASDEWISFMSFRGWWIDNHVDGWHLDKDLISIGNKMYDKSVCVYVPQWLNTFTLLNEGSRGRFMIGVSLDKRSSRFYSSCCNPITMKREWLGYFDDEQEASDAWRRRKLEIASQVKSDIDLIHNGIYRNIVKIITDAR